MNRLTITLTGRPPVSIDRDLWPVLCSAHRHDGREYESQANRHFRLTVRQHQDGRAVVYGSYQSNWQDERDRRGGELLTADQAGLAHDSITDAIRRVCDALDFDRAVAEECIASMPAEVLS